MKAIHVRTAYQISYFQCLFSSFLIPFQVFSQWLPSVAKARFTARGLHRVRPNVQDMSSTVLSLLSAHALISAHPCFSSSIIPQVEPIKRPPLHLRLGLFGLVDPPIMPILKTRPPGTHI